MAIDWCAIKERAKYGLLTTKEADALVEMAKRSPYHPYCHICNRWVDTAPHRVGCPVAVLDKGEEDE